MFLRSIFTAWLVIFALPQADLPQLIEVRVWVNATAKNGLGAEITQHAVEMLEQLPNVTVVDRFPYHYELQIVGLKESDNVALAVAALRIFDNSKITDELVRHQTDGLYQNVQLAVVASKYDNLQAMCREIVGRFESEVLKSQRRKH